MYKLALILLVVILAFITLFLVKQTEENEEILKKEERAVTLEGDFGFHNWREFSSPNGHFKVLLPTLPQHAMKNINDPKLQAKKNYDMYVSEKPDGTVFMINLITFPDIPQSFDKEKLLMTVMNDMMDSDPKNELKTVEAGKYNGYPSLDFAMKSNEINIDAKTFIIGNTLYVLSRIVKDQNYNSNEYNFFINSFELSSPSNGS